ncbi:MAG TPA: thiosulfohydrolase SoxB [Candidatus Tyrphobacter sp.]
MFTRRDFLAAAAATAMLPAAAGNVVRAAARQRITERDLIEFEPLGQVTLLNFTDIHAQLMPVYFREPSVNVGVGGNAGVAPHLTGAHFLRAFGITKDTAEAYALTCDDFTALAREYGRLGGLDRMATLVKAIRSERPGRTLLLDGGDTWQGSYTALKERGADMVTAMNALGVDAMTAHWEFTYGTQRVEELKRKLAFPLLCGNVKDATWEAYGVFESYKIFERGGVRIAVIGQAYPYTPIANPAWLFADWSFGIDEAHVQSEVDAARAAGAVVVVLLSHNGFDIDRKLAGRVRGIDVILTGHTHDAIPVPVIVGKTILIAAGSHGKFLARLDLDVRGGQVAAHRFRLIPIFSDAIAPDPQMAQIVEVIRRPYRAHMDQVLGRTDDLLYRRGNFSGTFDDLICDALLEEREAEIALSPGFRWGATLLPGQPIRREDVFSQTAITYPAAYRTSMSGAQLRNLLEDVADNLFNPDPYYQQGGDMVRVGGMSYTIDVAQTIGKRISEMRLLRTGDVIDPGKQYVVAGWASVQQGTQGPAVYDVLQRYIERHPVVKIPTQPCVRILGADPRGIS